MQFTAKFSDLVLFEKIVHILIDEGFVHNLIEMKLLPQLSFTERLTLLQDVFIPVEKRIGASFNRFPEIYRAFGLYLSMRDDVLPLSVCHELAKIHDDQKRVQIAKATKEVRALFKSKRKKIQTITYEKDWSSLYTLYFRVSAPKTHYVVGVKLFSNKKELLTHIQLLQEFADVIDKTYPTVLSVPVKVLVHDFMVDILSEVDFAYEKHCLSVLKKQKKYTSLIKGYDKQLTTKHFLVYKTNAFFTGIDKKRLIKEKKISTDDVVRIGSFLLQPLFHSGVLLQNISPSHFLFSRKSMDFIGPTKLQHLSLAVQRHLIDVVYAIANVDKADFQKIMHEHIAHYCHTKATQKQAERAIIKICATISDYLPSVHWLTYFISEMKRRKIIVPQYYEQLHSLFETMFFFSTIQKPYVHVSTQIRHLLDEHSRAVINGEIAAHNGFMESRAAKTVQIDQVSMVREHKIHMHQVLKEAEIATTRVVYAIVLAAFIVSSSVFLVFQLNQFHLIFGVFSFILSIILATVIIVTMFQKKL